MSKNKWEPITVDHMNDKTYLTVNHKAGMVQVEVEDQFRLAAALLGHEQGPTSELIDRAREQTQHGPEYILIELEHMEMVLSFLNTIEHENWSRKSGKQQLVISITALEKALKDYKEA